jgi:hypothetical protein|tara:strand:+ start:294 stop:602 length:309 start_codon:yes stop_codon:yes gene_type:complete
MSQLNNLSGKDVNDGIDSTETGATVLTGSGIDFYRLLMIKRALQAQCRGFRLSNKVAQGTTLARRHLGLKGNKHSLLNQVNEIIDLIQFERSVAVAATAEVS